MINEKLNYVSGLLADVLNYMQEDAECICDDVTLNYANEHIKKLKKAISEVKKLKNERLVPSEHCLIVSPEDFDGYDTTDLTDKELDDMVHSAARGLNNNDSVMECFWMHIELVAEENGLKKLED